MQYRRVILKFSGEVLKSQSGDNPISHKIVENLCKLLADLREGGLGIGVVLGGGNIFRGLPSSIDAGYDRVRGDYMGMLATAINCLAVRDCLEKMNVQSEVLSALPMPSVCKTFTVGRGLKYISNGKILLLAGGTGSAFFSTDSAAALRANELHADIIIKATKVDGVYDKDPNKYADAKKFDTISFSDVLKNRIKVMDSTAFSLCMDNNIPILVLNASDISNIKRALWGEKIGTLVSQL